MHRVEIRNVNRRVELEYFSELVGCSFGGCEMSSGRPDVLIDRVRVQKENGLIRLLEGDSLVIEIFRWIFRCKTRLRQDSFDATQNLLSLSITL
jgi:hypothetical protein